MTDRYHFNQVVVTPKGVGTAQHDDGQIVRVKILQRDWRGSDYPHGFTAESPFVMASFPKVQVHRP